MALFWKKFDSLFVDNMFHTDSAGNTYVYPWTGFGLGYLMQTPEKQRQIRILYRTWMLSLFTLFIVFVMFIDFVVLYGVIGITASLAALLLLYSITMYALVKDLPRGHKRSIGQFYQDMGKRRSWTFLLFLTLLSMLVFPLAGWMLFTGMAENVWLGSLLFILIGLILWVGIYMMYHKFKGK